MKRGTTSLILCLTSVVAAATTSWAALLGVNLTDYPRIAYQNTSLVSLTYDPITQLFSVNATPTAVLFSSSESPRLITGTRGLKLRVLVDNSGNLVGGVIGDDLVISGTVTRVVGTVTNVYSGILLTGEVSGFGYLDSGTTDQYDLRFTPTGGLMFNFFSCGDIGIQVTSELSTFVNLFAVPFQGRAKGNVGLEDLIQPNITCPFDNTVTNVQCTSQNGTAGAYVTFPDPVAADNCDTNVMISCSPTNGSFFALAKGTNMTSTLVTCIAMDTSGNTNSCTFTITVVDNLAPEFDSNPVLDPCEAEPLVLNTDHGSCTATLTFPKPTAMDSCCTSSVPVSVSAIDENGFIIVLTEFTSNDVVFLTGQFPQTCIRSNVITATANDGRGNSTQRQCFLYVIDNEPPSIECPSNQVISCTNGPVFFMEPTASDNCTNLTVSCTPSNGSFLAIGPHVITCTAVDGCGNNTNSCNFRVDVVDSTPPTISCPTNITVECGESTDPSNTGQATATDDCDSNPTITHEDAVSGTCPVTISRTWFAVDDSGNTNQCVQTIHVQDTTPPSISCPDDKQLQCGDSTLPSNTGSATATDTCSSVTITYSDAPGATNCTGRAGIDRTWKAMDSCSNSLTCVQHITFVDTNAPSISCPGDRQLQCGDSTATNSTGAATATDNCGRPATIGYSDATGSTNCTGRASIDRTWTAMDACGVSTTCVQHITFVDTNAPSIYCPGDKQLQCGDSTATNNTGAATATDNCGRPVTITYSDATGATNCTGRAGIDRTWTATDSCSNSIACIQHITFVDTNAPSIYCPGDRQLQCGDSTATNNTGAATASDNCGRPVTISYSDATGATNCTGRAGIDRTWKATDSCSNSITCVQHITFVDTNAPTLTVPTGGDLGCNPTNAPTDASVKTMVTASDNCSPTSVTITHVDSGTACANTRTFTVTAKDNCNNSSPSKTVVYTWKTDTNAPVVTVPTGSNLGCNPTNLPTVASVKALVTVSDNCTVTATNITYADTTNGCTRTRTFTVTASDSCKTSAAKMIVYTWTADTTRPVITCPAPLTVCGQAPAPDTSKVTATDNCGGVPTISFAGDVTNGVCPKIITRTYKATDACGNSTNCTQTITVNCNPPCTLTAPNPLPVPDFSGFTLSGPSGNFNYSWSITATTGPNWSIISNATSQTVYYQAGSSGTATFQLIVTDKATSCVSTCSVTFGLNASGATPGFWGNKNGLALITAADFTALNTECLRDGTGANKDFTSSLSNNKTAFDTYLANRNAVNMAYQFSAHLAAFTLNVRHNFICGNTVIQVPGCGTSMTANALITAANNELCAHGSTPSGSAYRAYQECLKNALALANGNTTTTAKTCP